MVIKCGKIERLIFQKEIELVLTVLVSVFSGVIEFIVSTLSTSLRMLQTLRE